MLQRTPTRKQKVSPQNGRKHLQIVSDKELVSRIYKEPLHLNKKTTQLKWTKDLNRHE